MPKRKTFRLFVSSTFADFKEERNILRTIVFPEVRRYYEERGFNFQPIDLRWGVSQEAQLDQRTLEICLNEVRSCKTYPHPNFLVMLGDRYGWVPLPFYIEQTEFEQLLVQCAKDDVEILKHWYILDQNQLPVSYTLLERRGEAETIEGWEPIEIQMRSALQKAAKQVLNGDAQKKYFQSATEAEVMEGVFPYLRLTEHQLKLAEETPNITEIDSQHIFGFFRSVEPETICSQKFLGKREEFKKALRFKNEVNSLLEENNKLSISANQVDANNLSDDYHNELIDRVTEFLKRQLKPYLKKQEEISDLETEKYRQKEFAKQKRADFLGRENILSQIQKYLQKEDTQPLVIYGSSGKGKSALIAKAIEQAEKANIHKVVYRFIGATPESSSSKAILLSLLKELKISFKEEVIKPNLSESGLQSINNGESFIDFSYRVYDTLLKIEEPTVIFLDALDQLMNRDDFLWLPKKLPQGLKVVISALEDINYKTDSKAFERLQKRTGNTVLIPEFTYGKELLLSLLSNKQRTLQSHQISYFNEQFAKVKSPLFVLVAAQELQYWKSYDGTHNHKAKSCGVVQDLSDSQQAVIKEYIDNLSSFYHQDKRLVERILCTIWSSREGISEYELLSLLNSDLEFINQVSSKNNHKNLTGELPNILWIQVFNLLTPFLSKKTKDGQELLFFFHREFIDVVSELTNEVEIDIVLNCTEQQIKSVQEKSFDSNRWGRLYTEFLVTVVNSFEENILERHSNLFTILNEGWIKNFLYYINLNGFNFQKFNEHKTAILFISVSKIISKKLYLNNPSQWAENYTLALSNLAGSFKNVNRIVEAALLEGESLEILEKLYLSSPTQWGFDYIRVLNNLASSNKKVRRIAKAITLEEKSLDILKKLYVSGSFQWIKHYTIILNNLAFSYNEVDRLSDAIVLHEENVEILKKLYTSSSAQWIKRFYNAALNNLANSYEKIGRIEKAIALKEKSVDIHKKLYASNPSQWVDAYSRVLNNLALSYEELDRLSEAIVLHEENISILKKLYASNPSQWAELYMTVLINLAGPYRKVNRLETAMVLLEESLGILKALYASSPAQWADNYGRVLHNFSFSYEELDRLSEAIAFGKESLRVLKLYVSNSSQWEENYISVLDNLANSYEKSNCLAEVVALYEDNIKILNFFFVSSPSQRAETYIKALNHLSFSYRRSNCLAKAIVIGEESLRILKKMYASNPSQWAVYYVSALTNLAFPYKKLDRLTEAIVLEEKIIEVLKKLYVSSPSQWAKAYEKALNNLAFSYTKVDRLTEAIILKEENIGILKKLYASSPSQWVESYIKALNSLMLYYENVDRLVEAIVLGEESIGILKKMYASNPSQCEEIYIVILNELAFYYTKNDRLTDALELYKEIENLLKKHYPNDTKGFKKIKELIKLLKQKMAEQNGKEE